MGARKHGLLWLGDDILRFGLLTTALDSIFRLYACTPIYELLTSDPCALGLSLGTFDMGPRDQQPRTLQLGTLSLDLIARHRYLELELGG